MKVVSLPRYNGLPCRKITVQVEFWKLVHGVVNGPDSDRLSDGTRPDHHFVIRRVKRVGLPADASAERKIALRASLYATDRSPREGALLSVTVGKSLMSEEPPKEVEVGGEDLWGRATVDFRSQRVAVTPGSQPTDLCQTDLYPTDLRQTPDYGFDINDVLRSPTP